MKQLLAEGRRLLVCLSALIVVACGLAATAGAATDDATGQTSSTVGPAASTVHFSGHLNFTNMLPADPVTGSPCPPGTADPVNAVCEHFGVTVAAPGTFQTCVAFDAGTFDLNDLDLYLV